MCVCVRPNGMFSCKLQHFKKSGTGDVLTECPTLYLSTNLDQNSLLLRNNVYFT